MDSNTRQPKVRGTVRVRLGMVLASLIVTLASTVTGLATARPAAAQSVQSGPVSAFGDATAYGAPTASRLNAPLVAIARTPSGKGYWLVSSDGGVFNYGNAGFYGSAVGGGGSAWPVVGMASTPNGKGYWTANDAGGVDAFGDAPNEVGLGVFPNAPVVGIAATPVGMGYWMVSADGGIFSSGSASFYGSMGGKALNAAIVGMAPTPDGRGYWEVASDGGVFSFGDAQFYGSMGGKALNGPVVGMAATPDGRGYWLVAADGGVFSFGDAAFFGSTGSQPRPTTPVLGMAATPSGHGYWLTTTDKTLPPPSPLPSVLAQCEGSMTPSVKPHSINLLCNSPNSLMNLTWSSWTPTTASASGTYSYDNCTPNCAQGTLVAVPATVRLGYPIETIEGKEFAMVSYTYADPSKAGRLVTESTVVPTNIG